MELAYALAHNNTCKAVVMGALIIFAICMFLDQVTRNVQMGVSDDMAPEQRHGNAWVIENGRVVQKRFSVDRPYLLDEPNRYQIQDMFGQLQAMGYEPEYLEILVGGKTRVYRPDQNRPVYAVAH